MKLSDSIKELPGVGELTAEAFKRLGVNTIENLLFFLPFRIEDRSNLLSINALTYGQEAVISGEIVNIHSRRTKRGSLMIIAKIKDETGTVNAVWFNQRFLLSQLKAGENIMLFGAKKLAPPMGNPFMVKKIVRQAEFTPVYPATKGLHQGVIIRLIKHILPLAEKIPNVLPEKIITDYHLAQRKDAIRNVHQPANQHQLDRAKELFGFEELLGLGISVQTNKKKRLERIGDKLIIDTDYLKKFTSSLSFTLTTGQRRAAWEIINGMTNGYRANRLLYGEVGSGKTIVALLAAIAIIRSGKKVLILVPTTTLAGQQANNIKEFVGQDFTVSLITAAVKEKDDSEIIIGTHALLNKSADFKDIGLVIIDEQQRFGVKQRQKLLEHHLDAHLLMTTATPIPRSLAQTILGNLDITYLLDKPPHQQKVTTKKFLPENRASVLTEIKRRIARGEPGYVICPAIETEEARTLFTTEDKKSVLKEVKRLQKELPRAKISPLHGQMPADKKTRTLEDFLEGKIDILVSTTVVEVGIDNPDATWMIIENADMYGLSTLHQLRGRVGRGKKSSVCFVSLTTTDEKANKRLNMLEKSDNGLELAEADLEIRGPGEILGDQQSGLPNLKFANLSNKKLVKEVFALAKEIVDDGIDKYPKLKKIIIETDGLAANG